MKGARTVLLWILAASASCDPYETHVCGEGAQAAREASLSVEPDGTDGARRMRVWVEPGPAVHHVRVFDVGLTQEASGAWTGRLSAEQLDATRDLCLADPSVELAQGSSCALGSGGTVLLTLEGRVVDVCDGEAAVSAVTALDWEPVGPPEVVLTDPRGLGWLPRDPTTNAAVVVRFDAAAAGSTVEVEVDGGSLLDGQASAFFPVVADGGGAAARTFVRPSTTSTDAVLTVTATLGTASAEDALRVVEPPELLVTDAAPPAGGTVVVSAATGGVLESCSWTDSTSFHVSRDGAGLTGSVTFTDAPDLVALVVEVDAAAPDQATTTFTCADGYEQHGEVGVTVQRP